MRRSGPLKAMLAQQLILASGSKDDETMKAGLANWAWFTHRLDNEREPRGTAVVRVS
jgi:hypothetical protein